MQRITASDRAQLQFNITHMHYDKPFSPACEENKRPIREVLARYLDEAKDLLEIGSGTGQHAVYFAAAFPRVRWQTSDVAAHLAGIRQWIEEAALANLPPPIELDVTGCWPDAQYDAVFSANTAHIMSHDEVEAMLRGVSRVLQPNGVFALYGPFNYNGRYTSESNAQFDLWLKQQDPRSCIKDYDALAAIADDVGLAPVGDHEMPVNNWTLVWRRAGMASGSDRT